MLLLIILLILLFGGGGYYGYRGGYYGPRGMGLASILAIVLMIFLLMGAALAGSDRNIFSVILEELYGHKMHGRKILSSVHTDGTKSADVPKGFSGMLVCSQQPKPLSITARKSGSVRAGCASRALAQLSAGRKFALLPRDVRGQGAP
jgi:hypothetical protein